MNMTENQLRREIGFTVAVSLVIGTVIGSGVFMKPGIVIASAGGSTMALWAWILGGIITLAGGLTVAEISSQIPKTGGLYVYLEEVYGKMWGFLSGWVQAIVYGPAIIAALGLYFGMLFVHLFGMNEQWQMWVGVITVLFLGTVNSIGTKYGGLVQTISTVGKLIPIALIIIFGLWKGNNDVLGMASGVTNVEISMGAAILATLFAYDGWMLVGFVAGEMKNPEKLLPRAIIVGLSVVTAIYLLVNVAMLHVLPADKIVALGPNAAGTAASILFGDIGGKLISVGILVSIFGCLNGKILTFPRVVYAMAERGQLPASQLLSRVHPNFGTPFYATASQIILAIIMMVISNPDRLSDIAIFAVYLFYIQAFFAVFILRKRNPGIKRVYSVPLYPIIPIVAIIGSGFVVISTIMDKPFDSLIAIGIAVIGLPVFWLLERRI
ncbi:serine/threonine exchange transporter (LAT family) [Aneurinibacillus soli]|uniref:Serine/threonine exchanger SteT n=1 Tax=Aneurinibacillus soli TaxID=1500254 RepID=A0A0U5AWL4_9BACL|nr:serine/threonine exchange transporter (LAT family) [Aneurinibacillus soli]BAU26368.1 Serine/threonine exchanger SteT [Aneurinibacillus soli]